MRSVRKSIIYKQFSECDFELSSKVYVSCVKTVDRRRKEVHSIHSAEVSLQRAHKSIYDVLRSNTWQYFITLTFGDPERVSDQYCRDQFSKWRKMVRRKFPSMYYVSVPEYHSKGSIHYHIVVGGISAADLGLEDSGRVLHLGKSWLREDFVSHGFQFNDEIGEGATIYNVSKWTCGWSTATVIRCSAAVSHYVSKYLTKNNIDPRFFNKRRFYVSSTCIRPFVAKDDVEVSFDVERLGVELNYYKPKHFFGKYDCAEDVIRARLAGIDVVGFERKDSTDSE